MPTCALCGDDVFDDEDGLFYCSTCGTQSQDLRVEESQKMDYEDTTVSDRRQREIKGTLSGAKVPNARAHLRREHSIGKVWSFHEGFQFLLKAHVDALIKMGFSPTLKEVVKQLWFRYLQLTTTLFQDNESIEVPFKKGQLNCGRTVVHGHLPSYMRKRRHIVTSSDSDDTADTDGIKRERNDETPSDEDAMDIGRTKEAYSKSQNSENELKTDSLNDKEESSDDESTAKNVRKDKKTNHKKIELQHVVVFCYLGLVVCKEPVFLCDLIRWCEQGHLPYYKANDILPEDMKFSGTDIKTYCTNKLLGHHSLLNVTNKVLKTLAIEAPIGGQNAKILLAQLVADFHFDDRIFHLACKLLNYIELERIEKSRKRTSSSFENLLYCGRYTIGRQMISYTKGLDGRIAALLIVTVKMLYYLDDNNEILGNTRDALLTQIKSTLPVQPWKDWVTLRLKDQRRKLFNGIPKNEFELREIRDASSFVDYCTKDAFKSFLPRPTTTSCLNGGRKFSKATTTEKCEQYFTWLRDAAEYHSKNLDLDGIKRVPTSFPSSCDDQGEVFSKNYSPLSPNCKAKENTSSLEHGSYVPDSTKDASSQSLRTKSSNQFDDYVIYHSISPNDERLSGDWHESYAFLLNIVGRRIEMSAVHLQTYVEELEHHIFQYQYRQLGDEILSYVNH